MTIREKLKARLVKARVSAIGFWLVLVTTDLVMDGPHGDTLNTLAFFGFAGSVLYVLMFVQCPSCGLRLGREIGYGDPPDCCPGCGTGFDRRA